MKAQSKYLKILFLILAGLLVSKGDLFLEESTDAVQKEAAFDPDEIQVPPPPFSDDIFPCMDCHEDMDVNPAERTLTDEHDMIVLDHGEKWCFDCHNPENRDVLRLADGELVDFKASYKLCGQCHGLKLRDWRLGIHGKRTGQWEGQKKYLLCAHCHDPHAPRFKPVKPMPPPDRPENIKR